jgi:hypothetical protein
MLKKLINLLQITLLLFVANYTQAQSNLTVALKYQVFGTPTISGNNYTINGTVNDVNGV